MHTVTLKPGIALAVAIGIAGCGARQKTQQDDWFARERAQKDALLAKGEAALAAGDLKTAGDISRQLTPMATYGGGGAAYTPWGVPDFTARYQRAQAARSIETVERELPSARDEQSIQRLEQELQFANNLVSWRRDAPALNARIAALRQPLADARARLGRSAFDDLVAQGKLEEAMSAAHSGPCASADPSKPVACDCQCRTALHLKILKSVSAADDACAPIVALANGARMSAYVDAPVDAEAQRAAAASLDACAAAAIADLQASQTVDRGAARFEAYRIAAAQLHLVAPADKAQQIDQWAVALKNAGRQDAGAALALAFGHTGVVVTVAEEQRRAQVERLRAAIDAARPGHPHLVVELIRRLKAAGGDAVAPASADEQRALSLGPPPAEPQLGGGGSRAFSKANVSGCHDGYAVELSYASLNPYAPELGTLDVRCVVGASHTEEVRHEYTTAGGDFRTVNGKTETVHVTEYHHDIEKRDVGPNDYQIVIEFEGLRVAGWAKYGYPSQVCHDLFAALNGKLRSRTWEAWKKNADAIAAQRSRARERLAAASSDLDKDDAAAEAMHLGDAGADLAARLAKY